MTILLCTPESFLLTSLEYRFRKNGWQLNVANEADEALQKAIAGSFDLIVVDLQLESYQGLDIVQRLTKEICPETPILVGAPLSEDSLMMEGLRLGAKDFIVAPYKPDELVMRIRHLLQKAKVAG